MREKPTMNMKYFQELEKFSSFFEKMLAFFSGMCYYNGNHTLRYPKHEFNSESVRGKSVRSDCEPLLLLNSKVNI